MSKMWGKTSLPQAKAKAKAKAKTDGWDIGRSMKYAVDVFGC